jgi:hypothetical protein
MNSLRHALTFPIPAWVLFAAYPIIPVARTLWYMEGEDGGSHFDYFTYTVSEGWPFVGLYVVVVILLSVIFRPSSGEHSDVLDR